MSWDSWTVRRRRWKRHERLRRGSCASLDQLAERDLEAEGYEPEYPRTEFKARIEAEDERERLIARLQKALAEVRTLSGLLPICSSCKKIRDDEGYWTEVEIYILEHSDADFTHGLCPDCAERLYPGFYKRSE